MGKFGIQILTPASIVWGSAGCIIYAYPDCVKKHNQINEFFHLILTACGKL